MTDTDHSGRRVRPTREAGLKAQGWERRSVAAEPRLSEVAEEYRSLGFEVHLEPFDPLVGGEGGCTSCFEVGKAAELSKIIYTRPPSQGRKG